MNELAIIETLTPAVFTEEGKLDSVLKDIQSRVANFNGDITTAKGRDEIKSFAFRIAKSKTAIDNLGKECVEDWKRLSKDVDAKRRRIWDAMEVLQHQVRKPLTDWEQAEENRVSELKARIGDLTVPANTYNDSASLKQLLADIELIAIDESFQELQEIAATAKAATVTMLQNEIAAAEKREADAAELERLRQEAAIRAQQDREEAIRKEAAEKAIKEAETKAKAEREATEKRELEARLVAEKAAQDAEAKMQTERDAAARKELELRLEAEKAQREKLEAEQRAIRAVEEERQRVAAEQAKIAAEEAKREANKRHVASIHKKVVEAFQSAGVPATQAEAALNAICQGLVPNVTISY